MVGEGSILTATISAAAYALTGAVMSGLAKYGGWLFFSMSVWALVVAVYNMAARDPGNWLHILETMMIVTMASVLFYHPVKVDLKAIVSGLGTSADQSYASAPIIGGIATSVSPGVYGGAPAFTYWADLAGMALTGTVKSIVMDPKMEILPGLNAAIDSMFKDARVLDDKQVSANVEIWQSVVAPALLHQGEAGQKLQKLLNEQGLMGTFLSPQSSSSDLNPKEYQKAAKVEAAIKQSGVDLSRAVYESQPLIKSAASDMGAQTWTASAPGGNDNNGPGTGVVLPVMRLATYVGGKQNNVLNYIPVVGQALKYAFDPDHLGLVSDMFGTKSMTMNDAAQAYHTLGGSIIYAGYYGMGKQKDNLKLYKQYCEQRGTATCLAKLGELTAEVNQLHGSGKEGLWDKLTDFFANGISTGITAIAGVILSALAGFVATISPFLIAFTKAGAIFISIVGLFWMVMPGRFWQGIEWMIGPIIFVNLWNALYIVWSAFESRMEGLMTSLAVRLDFDGSSSMDTLMLVLNAMVILAMPVIAWNIVFGRAGAAFRHSAQGKLEGFAMMLGAMAMKAGKDVFGHQGGSQGNNSGDTSSSPGPGSPPGNAPGQQGSGAGSVIQNVPQNLRSEGPSESKSGPEASPSGDNIVWFPVKPRPGSGDSSTRAYEVTTSPDELKRLMDDQKP